MFTTSVVASRFIPSISANNAYDRLTEADAAWMARIVARFRDAHVRAMAARGRFSDPVVESELARILIGRRDKILERWLTRLSPLTWPEIRGEGAEVCMQDLAVWSGLRDAATRRYVARAWHGDALAPIEVGAARAEEDGWLCVPLPESSSASAAHPDYVVLDIVASSEDRETASPARLHLYALDAHTHRLVGLERPESAEAPTP